MDCWSFVRDLLLSSHRASHRASIGARGADPVLRRGTTGFLVIVAWRGRYSRTSDPWVPDAAHFWRVTSESRTEGGVRVSVRPTGPVEEECFRSCLGALRRRWEESPFWREAETGAGS
jgi:hypothetical protein